MSNMEPPDIPNGFVHELRDCVEKGTLSGLQLESIVYAWMKFECRLSSSGHRAGFYMERTMRLVNLLLDETREVKQWQYLEWPTQGVPNSGVNLVRMIQEIELHAKAQIVMPQEESIYGNSEIINEHVRGAGEGREMEREAGGGGG